MRQTATTMSCGLVVLGSATIAIILEVGLATQFASMNRTLEVMIVAVFAITLLLQITQSHLEAAQDFKRLNLVYVTPHLISVIVLVALTLMARLDIEHAFAAFLVGQIGALGLAIVLVKRTVNCQLSPIVGKQLLQNVRQFVDYGSKIFLTNIFAFGTVRLAVLLIAYHLGTAAAGVYFVASQIALGLGFLPDSVALALFPRLASMSDHSGDQARLTALAARCMLVVSSMLALALAAISYPLITMLYGTPYVDAAWALTALMPGVAFAGVSHIFSLGLNARVRPDLNLKIGGLIFIFTVGLLLLLLPKVGIVGAAAISSLGEGIGLMLRAWAYRTLANMPLATAFIPTPADLRTLRGQVTKLFATQTVLRKRV